MSGLNWRNAKLSGRRSTSMLDEQERRGRDAAARWLERKAQATTKKVKAKRHRATPAQEAAE